MDEVLEKFDIGIVPKECPFIYYASFRFKRIYHNFVSVAESLKLQNDLQEYTCT